VEAGTAPTCPRCEHRHLVGLPCWSGRYVVKLRALVLATYGDVCVHCGEHGARSPEHVHPRSMGGTDAIGNLRPAHLSCNIRRGTEPMPGWGAGPVTAETSGRW
jgi:5-methylcytosine-specific restriction endonuclease McrA